MRFVAWSGFILLALARTSLAVSDPAASKSDVDRAVALEKKGDLTGAIAAAKQAVEEDPDSIPAADEFQKASQAFAMNVYKTGGQAAYQKAEPELRAKTEAQFLDWIKEYPNSPGVNYGLGKFYADSESPKAKPYLLKAVAANPKLADAFEMLSIDAERWGDNKGSREYMREATVAEPDSPDYAFYYAMSFKDVDPKKYFEMGLDVAKRFPTSERGAQALYWLGFDATSDTDKIRYWEMAKDQFPPSKFGWSSDAMSMLFDAYARTDPDKALALAEEMKPIKVDYGNSWDDNANLAKNLVQVRKLEGAKDFAGAKALLDSSKISKYSSDLDMFALLKADLEARAGQPADAYKDLMARYAQTPEDAVGSAIQTYGAQLGKSSGQIDHEVWAARDAAAKPAPAFDLDQYLANGKRSLTDYRGKVVLLTFWFPGCGPCRGEFPHFENVLRRFKGQSVDYVGINVLPEQDAYVKSFMKGTRYSFTPLREDGKQQETDYHVRGEPTNFLIDQTGRIVYSNFRAEDPKSERVLELMIRSLLDHKAS